MNIRFLHIIAIFVPLIFIQGCSTTPNKTVITNAANLGVDFDTSPPHIEMAISSTRSVLTPSFEGGQALPVLSGISTRAQGGGFFEGLSSTVATGDAAYTLSFLYADCNKNVRPLPDYPPVELSRKPEPFPDSAKVKSVRITHTSLTGARIGMHENFPLLISSVKMGFNRHEEIRAPVSVEFLKDKGGRYLAGTPSFLATIDHWDDLKDRPINRREGEPPIRLMQYLAIGESATQLALRSDVRRSLFQRITPDMQDTFCEDDYETRVW